MKLVSIALMVAGGMVIYFALHSAGNTGAPTLPPTGRGGPV